MQALRDGCIRCLGAQLIFVVGGTVDLWYLLCMLGASQACEKKGFGEYSIVPAVKRVRERSVGRMLTPSRNTRTLLWRLYMFDKIYCVYFKRQEVFGDHLYSVNWAELCS